MKQQELELLLSDLNLAIGKISALTDFREVPEKVQNLAKEIFKSVDKAAKFLRENSADFPDRCGCGRPSRYWLGAFPDLIYSCNKYRRCPTYQELDESLKITNHLLNAYRQKRAVDGLNGRTWDASAHFDAEAKIEEFEGKRLELLGQAKNLLEQAFPNAQK